MRVDAEWLLTAERAAVHLPTATAVIADLHLGYERARQRSGEAVPLRTPDEVLAPLGRLALRHHVERLVIAGDLFEAGPSADVLSAFLQGLRGLRLEPVGVVPGNHDRDLSSASKVLPVVEEGVRLGGWRVLHGHGRLGRDRVILGHIHPCLTWDSRRAAPCYLVGPRRLVLPAFSADARGANVLRDRRWSKFRCGVIAGEDVLDFGPVGTLAARLRRARA
jgi:putative SbcD/Mre11-related phosphoesterase